MASHEHMIGILSVTLGIISNETDKAVTAQEKTFGPLAAVILDNKIALGYILTKQEGVYVLANSSYFVGS